MKLGFIGLGRMGNRMVIKLLEEGHGVVVWNRTKEKISDLRSQISDRPYVKNLEESESIEDLINKLSKPRIIWSMLPAGDATEQILMGPAGVSEFVEESDTVVDGANSHFEDTDRRYQYFSDRKVLFLGIGVSGGIVAAKAGYPLMVGGAEEAYEYIRPILDSLAKPSGGHEYFGEGGAGHFVKMVHNAIEYGYMQAIGEGFGVLEKAPYDLDLAKVANLYTKGTLVSGFMMDRTAEVLGEDSNLSKIEGYIEASGEADWAIDQAKKEGVVIANIEQALKFREKSREDKSIAATFAARMVSALRKAFGGHETRSSVIPAEAGIKKVDSQSGRE